MDPCPWKLQQHVSSMPLLSFCKNIILVNSDTSQGILEHFFNASYIQLLDRGQWPIAYIFFQKCIPFSKFWVHFCVLQLSMSFLPCLSFGSVFILLGHHTICVLHILDVISGLWSPLAQYVQAPVQLCSLEGKCSFLISDFQISVLSCMFSLLLPFISKGLFSKSLLMLCLALAISIPCEIVIIAASSVWDITGF